MARRKQKNPGKIQRLAELLLRIRRAVLRAVFVLALLAAGLIVLGAYVNPWTTPYMLAERFRLGDVQYIWTPIDDIAPIMARAVVAAEDANFCQHWGFDVDAIRDAIEDGGTRGASTISQQTVKNVYLWHGRMYVRKALETMLTPMLELFWSKRRIVEVYLNIAEFDEGVFGVQAAAQHYYGVDAAQMTDTQAARLAAILPDPKGRSAANPSNFVRKRAQSVLSGAATIARDGRADCFQS